MSRYQTPQALRRALEDLAQHRIQGAGPFSIQFAKPAVSETIGMSLAVFPPEQLEREAYYNSENSLLVNSIAWPPRVALRRSKSISRLSTESFSTGRNAGRRKSERTRASNSENANGLTR